MKILVTGGAGFIGSTFIKFHLQKDPTHKIINLDNLSIGSNLKNLDSIQKNLNYQFIKDDIKNFSKLKPLIDDVDLVINFAAETHVDRSIANPTPFIETNIIGTFNILEALRKSDKSFLHVSTDEVYGDAEAQKSFNEHDNINPGNPYSASKASAEILINSYVKTYGIKSIISRCSNNFGPFQFPEKLIPKTIIRALKNLSIPLYGSGNQIRSWIYVLDHVTALESLISKGKFGETYNITAWNEITNKELVEQILLIMEKPKDLIQIVDDRPGHDNRYSVDSKKIHSITGWKPTYDFKNALKETITWYIQNTSWWEPLANEKTLHPQPWTLTW